MTTKKKTVSKCKCGSRKSQHSNSCRKCYEKRQADIKTANRAIFETGSCPDCGSGLVKNLALTGWVQCEQAGADGFRKNDNKPPCSFQIFI